MNPGRRRLIRLAAGVLAALDVSARAAIPAGQAPPDVPIALLAGGEISLSQLRGQVVVINFWATWCGPCQREIPALNSIYATRHAHGLTLLGVNVDSDPRDVEAFLANHPAQFPIALDPDGKVGSAFGLDGMPMTLIVDRLGIVRWVHRGYARGDETDYAQRVDALLRGN